MKELGDIVENEYNSRVALLEQEAKKTIADAEIKMRSEKSLSDQSRQEELNRIRERQEWQVRMTSPSPPSYTFETKHGETINFEFYSQIEETTLMPTDVNELSVRVLTSKAQYVDIWLRFVESLLPSKLELSSGNEATLQLTLGRLETLFHSARPGYHSFLMLGKHPTIFRAAIGLGANLCCWWLIVTAFRHVAHPNQETLPIFVILAMLLFFATSALWIALMRYLYPMFEFAIGLHDSPRGQIRKFVWAVISGLVLGVVGNLISSYLSL